MFLSYLHRRVGGDPFRCGKDGGTRGRCKGEAEKARDSDHVGVHHETPSLVVSAVAIGPLCPLRNVKVRKTWESLGVNAFMSTSGELVRGMTCTPLVGDGSDGSAGRGITQQPVHHRWRVAARL